MKIIYNHFLPLPGFSAMMLFGVIFARKSARPLCEVEYWSQRVLICDNFHGSGDGGGISLGRYILLDFNYKAWDTGHRVGAYDVAGLNQARIRPIATVGDAWVAVIGIASGTHAATHNHRHCKGLPTGNYYRFWPEAWANRLGGIPDYVL